MELRPRKRPRTPSNQMSSNNNNNNNARVLPEFTVHPSKRDQLSDIVEVRQGQYGRSLMAKRDIPPGTIVATYAGRVYEREPYLRVLKKVYRASNKQLYLFDHPLFVNGKFEDSGIIQPAAPRKGWQVLARFYDAYGFFVNEPCSSCNPNCFAAFDFATTPKGRIIYVTSKQVPKDTELTMCYGAAYNRNYSTSCARANSTIARFWLPDRSELITTSDMTPDEREKYGMNYEGKPGLRQVLSRLTMERYQNQGAGPSRPQRRSPTPPPRTRNQQPPNQRNILARLPNIPLPPQPPASQSALNMLRHQRERAKQQLRKFKIPSPNHNQNNRTTKTAKNKLRQGKRKLEDLLRELNSPLPSPSPPHNSPRPNNRPPPSTLAQKRWDLLRKAVHSIKPNLARDKLKKAVQQASAAIFKSKNLDVGAFRRNFNQAVLKATTGPGARGRRKYHYATPYFYMAAVKCNYDLNCMTNMLGMKSVYHLKRALLSIWPTIYLTNKNWKNKIGKPLKIKPDANFMLRGAYYTLKKQDS